MTEQLDRRAAVGATLAWSGRASASRRRWTERRDLFPESDNAPHLEFDMGGHGHAVVTAGPDAIETEFVCVPRPLARAATPDGGPIRYHVAHRAERWRAGDPPRLVRQVRVGDPFPA